MTKRIHRCHAISCQKEIHPKLLMCLHHWRMVPSRLKTELKSHYMPGQEIHRHPNADYIRTAIECVNAVFDIERERKRKL